MPPNWAGQNGTIYITYGLNDLRAVGGVVAATIAAILRHHMRMYPTGRGGQQQKMLVAIDELPAIGLRNIADYLSTCGGYGITLLLYVQSVAQLQGMYGREGTRAILSNCAISMMTISCGIQRWRWRRPDSCLSCTARR